MNINYDISDGVDDWMYINVIDYEFINDLVVIFVLIFYEFWIIDYFIIMVEVVISFGGNSNWGGDLMFCWGNFVVYD